MKCLLMAVLLVGCALAPVRARATEAGDAIYRDGAFEIVGTWGGISFIWHAGLYYDYSAGSSAAHVIHATGDLMDSVKYQDFATSFVGSDNYLGSRTYVDWEIQWSGFPPTPSIHWFAPSYSTRQAIRDEAMDQLGAHYWDFGLNWKVPNMTILGYWIPGNLRCDGLVEHCYESVGLDPEIDEIQFVGGPMWQQGVLDDSWNDSPSAQLLWPASSNASPATALVQTTPDITLVASGSDGYSGLSYDRPYVYWYQTYENGEWSGWQYIGPDWSWHVFTMTHIGAIYRFNVVAYDNAGNGAMSADRYVLYDPPAGNLQVTIAPDAARLAGAQWRIDGGAWLPSGTSMVVKIGARTVDFSSVSNWTAPPAKTFTIVDGQTTTYTGVYAVALGHVQVFVQPSGATSEGARWNVDSGAWRTSGQVESNLPAANLVRIAYERTANWDAASTNWVAVVGSSTIAVTGLYTHATGSVRAFIEPTAVTNTARWRAVSVSSTSAWQTTGAELAGYDSATALTLEYNSVGGWATPSTQRIAAVRGRTDVTNAYQQVGQLNVRILPAEAVADGAMWTVSGATSSWYASGATVTGLIYGAHTIYYRSPAQMSNAWWIAPSDATASIPAGGSLMATGTYAATRGAVRVTLGPDGAVAAGARWQLSGYQPGVWRTNNESVVHVPTGAQAIAFNSVSGWVAPSNMNLTVVAGSEARTNGIYAPAFYAFTYVATNGGHVYPYTNWVTAATNIQTAIGVTASNGTVTVSNGFYGGRTGVLLGQAVRLRSLNGPAFTTVSGWNTTRCVQITYTNASIDGFTIRDGRADIGAGIHMTGGGLASNCVITACTALYYGGGVFMSQGGALWNSTVAGNVAQTNDAGGVYLDRGGLMQNCIVVSNLARKAGGSFVYYNGTIRNTLFAYNRAGHAYALPENGQGGGGVLCYMPGGLVESCTIVSNSALYGGGVFRNAGGELRNCIVFDNVADSSGPNHYGGGAGTTNCCISPGLGVNQIAGPPLWVDLAGGDFHLMPASPCLNVGTNVTAWMTGAKDLDGYPRIVDTVVDLGAYECTPRHYVSTTGGNVWPYVSWSDAATNVQAAVDAADTFDEVRLGAGVHRAGSGISINVPLVVTGVYGAASTVIDGSGAARCINAAADIDLSGVTVARGYATVGAGLYLGGTGSVIHACIIVSNTASQYGGGVFFAAAGGLVDRCELRANSAVANQGGGVYARAGCAIRDSLIVSNSAHEGAAAFLYQGATMDGCTVVSNVSSLTGAVRIYEGGAVLNSIVYYNNSDIGSAGSGSAVVQYTCTPSFGGTGNITGPPVFAAGGYHLDPSSPCIDAGQTQIWMSAATDYDGYPRVTGSTVDLGAWERSPVHYVTVGGPSAWPYRTWGTAAASPADAFGAAEPGDTVCVSNGLYSLGEELVFNKAVTVQSLAGASSTVLRAAGGHRVMTVTGSAIVRGFTLTNGIEDAGGAAYIDGGTLQESIAVGNDAKKDGGGIYVTYGAVDRCVIAGNRAQERGGGLFVEEGGAVGNCSIFDNQAPAGGGVYLHYAALGDSTVARNEADTGTGVYNIRSAVSNCVIQGNAGTAQFYNYEGAWSYNCTVPSIGTSCVTDDPLYADYGNGDFRLSSGSPAIDRVRFGAAVDLLGQVRPLDGDNDGEPAGDMGAYEFLHALADSDRDGMPDAWETVHFGNATNAIADANSDNDPDTDLREYQAGTDPFDPDSWLRFTRVSGATNGTAMLFWKGGTEVTQYIDSTTNLAAQVVAWKPIFTNVTPTAVTNMLMDAGVPDSPRIFRIRVNR